MKIIFYRSEKEREKELSAAFASGMRAHGDTCEVVPDVSYVKPQPGIQVAVTMGLSQASRRILDEYQEVGAHTVYIDKGYIHHTDATLRGHFPLYYRMSVDSFQPLAYFQKWPRPADRWEKMYTPIKSWRTTTDGPIILAGCSAKYAWWKQFPGTEQGKGDEMNEAPSLWAEQVVKEIRRYTDRPIIYRPKPSFKFARPIPGTEFVQARHLYILLRTAWALVTFASNAATEAVLAGVPVFPLGDAIASPLGLKNLSKIEDPYYPDSTKRQQWAWDLAYCHFSVQECKGSVAWQYLKEIIKRKERGEW